MFQTHTYVSNFKVPTFIENMLWAYGPQGLTKAEHKINNQLRVHQKQNGKRDHVSVVKGCII